MKWVLEVEQITFNGTYARERGQPVMFVTDRAVFRLEQDGIVLTELADGIDLERDVRERIGFEVRIADDLRPMDPRLFRSQPMRMLDEFRSRASDRP